MDDTAACCIYCDKPIPKARLKALPLTLTCVNCSTEQKKYVEPDGPDQAELTKSAASPERDK